MANCVNCNECFEKKNFNRGLCRFSLEREFPAMDTSARVELERMFSQPLACTSNELKGQFLCAQCWNLLKRSAKYRQACKDFLSRTTSQSLLANKRPRSDSMSSPETSLKRPRFTSTPLQNKKRRISRSKFGPKQVSRWDFIVNAIRARQYRRAIHGLYNASEASKRHFIHVVIQIVRKEIISLLNKRANLQLAKNVDIPSIQDFSWDNTMQFVSESAPLLLGVLKGAVTTRKNETTLIRGNRVNLKPKIGTSLAVLLHARAPQTCKFLQTLLSVQFWRGRLRRDTMKQLSRLGICVGPNAALSAIDNITKDFDAAALHLKKDMETSLQTKFSPAYEHDADMSSLLQSAPNIEDELVNSDKEDTILYSEGSNSLLSFQYLSDSDNSFNDDDGVQEDTIANENEEDEDENDHGYERGDDLDDDDDDENDVANDGSKEVEESSYETSLDTQKDSAEINVANASTKDSDIQLGFTFCWDNVGKKVTTRRPNENVKNKYINMALGYIALNRVQSTHLSWDQGDTINASNIPVASFIPGINEITHLENRMQIIVGRILVRHLGWYKTYLNQHSIAHILHSQTLESTYKSLLINLGVFDEDPCSTQGAIGIYSRLQQYVPVVNGKPCQIAVYGDGLSCERGNDAQRARANGLDPLERLEGLEPAVQEFHKEMILLQDFFDQFFNGLSVSDRGTICQIRNMLNYRQVKSDISDNFSFAWELMCLITETFVCLLAMDIEGMESRSDRPDSASVNLENGSENEQSCFFTKSCDKIVQSLWHKLDTDNLKHEDGSGPPIFCCGEDLEEDVIGCECRSNCPNGEFFHYSCVQVDTNNIVSPWYCSDECRNRHTPSYSYCTCKQDLGTDEPMIGCSAENACTKEEWYHMKCIGIDPGKKIKKVWYCSEECRPKQKNKGGKKTEVDQSQEKPDYKRRYSLALVWRGLNLMCRRDAVREADGDAMIAYWKLDLVNFFGNKHPKYVILAHRLIASVNGFVSPRLSYDLVHNRTVNYGGGIGRNLPLDFMNEILNRLFKDLLESAKGRYTDKTIDRCSQIIGPLGEALDNVFDANVVEKQIYRHRRRDVSRDSNIGNLIDFLQPEHLFKFIPGRQHAGFPNFEYNETPKNAGKFAAKVKQLSKKLDKRRLVVLDN